MKAKLVIDGIKEASVEGADREAVIHQIGHYFLQYVEDFEHSIKLEIENE
jgi:hypothetical protein